MRGRLREGGERGEREGGERGERGRREGGERDERGWREEGEREERGSEGEREIMIEPSSDVTEVPRGSGVRF